MDTLERLALVFEDTFTDDSYQFSEETTQEDIEEWDSLNQVRLLMAIEQEFGIKFALDEMEKLTGVAAISAVISEKLN
ncbi:MAG: acyl carrier protein [Porticoccaceae bacterium]|nr:acyl carrier protein [Pseudomonadales bacterium]MCP5172657.1 acyl carrier protein [Pseudomonadales bacterium]MCP5302131.1 acyl carrier protein [Pseudomonadales bacterium]